MTVKTMDQHIEISPGVAGGGTSYRRAPHYGSKHCDLARTAGH